MMYYAQAIGFVIAGIAIGLWFGWQRGKAWGHAEAQQDLDDAEQLRKAMMGTIENMARTGLRCYFCAYGSYDRLDPDDNPTPCEGCKKDGCAREFVSEYRRRDEMPWIPERRI